MCVKNPMLHKLKFNLSTAIREKNSEKIVDTLVLLYNLTRVSKIADLEVKV